MSLLGLGAYDDSPAAEASPAAPTESAIHLSIVDYDNDADAEPASEPAADASAVLSVSLDDEAVQRAVQRSVGTGGVQVSIVKKHALSTAAADAPPPAEAQDTAEPTADETEARAPYVIPDSPPGDVDPGLAERFAVLAQKTQNGQSVNEYIRKAQSFRNPNILEKLVAFFEVRDCGTNYPPSLYDPNLITRDDHYDRVEARRREWEERQARKQGERVNFASAGTVDLSAAGAAASSTAKPARKSKWDSSGSADPAAKRRMA
jgi:hypothetical protein